MTKLPVASMVLTAAVLLTAACAPAPAGRVGSTEEPTSPTGSANRVLTFPISQEPNALFRPLNTVGPTQAAFRVFAAGLSVVDGRGSVQPELVSQLPQINTDTWRLLPDGKMETTYRLRPGLTWHDGQLLGAEDFVFAYRVQTNPSGVIRASAPQRLMESVVAADADTLVIRWRAPYPRADDLPITDFSPIPRHIMGEAFTRLEQGDTSPEAFLNLPYWLGEYIGVGPYRLMGWVPGNQLEGAAFDNFALGKPKIDRVVVKIMVDDAVFTALLAGTIQIADLQLDQYQVLKRDWAPAGKGTLITSQGNSQAVFIQLKPEHVGHPALLDVRVRQALAHSLDRQALNEGIYDGQGFMGETLVPPTAPFFPEVDRAIIKYPYDPRRSEQLMSEAGYPKGSDGFFTEAAGARVVFNYERLLNSIRERTQAISVDTWKRAGFEVEPTVSPSRPPLDHMVKLPGIFDDTPSDTYFYSREIATESNRWAGANKIGFSDAGYDRLYQAYGSTLDQSERTRQFVQAQRIISEQIPALFHSFSFNLWAVAAGLSGPKGETKNIGTLTPSTQRYFNIHEWRWV